MATELNKMLTTIDSVVQTLHLACRYAMDQTTDQDLAEKLSAVVLAVDRLAGVAEKEDAAGFMALIDEHIFDDCEH